MTQNNIETAVEVKNITKSYPGVTANDSVDFKVLKGEIHALVGENGAGKSTLVKILYGIEQPDSGEIFINDKPVEINKVDKAIELGIGMVHQEFHLVPSFTAAENIGLGQEPRNSRGFIDWDELNTEVSNIANKYGLDVDPKLRMIDASVGIQQRTEILKTLYRNANILILDEPTAGVDVELRQDMWKVVESLRKTGVTIILTTHYIEEAEAIADRVGVINQGEIIVVDETKELLKKMGHKKLTVDLQEEVKEIPSSLVKYNLEIGKDKMSIDYTYNVQAKQTGITNLLQDLKDAGFKLKDLKTEQSTLEKIFVSLVKANKNF